MITFNLVELNRPKAIVQVESLLQRIDNSLLSLAKKRRDQIRFGFKSISNEDYYDFIQLQIIRRMLLSKSCNDNCLDCITMDKLVSLSTSLLYKFC